ncbi:MULTISPECIES: hypothetical protein [unclassified Haladaptatus]|uniref:hypothetical protein n=1 Tax=unclassified Haladaptatus TaxID=2622732 RepID=UPI0023E84F47|nr:MULTISPECIES: hypothetical protein [unclassified Haladaptatus]
MASPLVVDAGELTADEILTAIRDGQRVVVKTSMLGTPKQVTLRYDGDVFYCDTPTRLHKHTTEEEMRTCILKNGYTRDAAEADESG